MDWIEKILGVYLPVILVTVGSCLAGRHVLSISLSVGFAVLFSVAAIVLAYIERSSFQEYRFKESFYSILSWAGPERIRARVNHLLDHGMFLHTFFFSVPLTYAIPASAVGGIIVSKLPLVIWLSTLIAAACLLIASSFLDFFDSYVLVTEGDEEIPVKRRFRVARKKIRNFVVDFVPTHILWQDATEIRIKDQY